MEQAQPGLTYGRLTVRELLPGPPLRQDAIAVCVCGKEIRARAHHLVTGNTQSCGCLRSEVQRSFVASKHQLTHGKRNTFEYRRWAGMWYRTRHNAKLISTGIKVDPRWLEFESFFADMGPAPDKHHHISRVDSRKDYGPDNCRWAPKTAQASNRTSNVKIVYDGRTATLAQWAAERGMNPTTIGWRIRKGWTPERALTTPSRPPRPSNPSSPSTP